MGVDVNHNILKWARETAGLMPEEAAKSLGIKDTKKLSALDKLESLEAGNTKPAASLLRTMAEKYRRPLLTFYLASAPRKDDYGIDFRTTPDRTRNGKSEAKLQALIRNMQARQSLVKDILEDDEDITSLSFINSGKQEDKAGLLATLHKVLGVNHEQYASQSSTREAFNLLRQKAEDAGVFVLLKRNLGNYRTDMEPSVFRGIALADDIAPFIVINNNDAIPAHAFTLLHEMVHLILGESGISGPVAVSDAQTETICDEVAADFLLPAKARQSLVIDDNIAFEELDSLVNDFADKHRLSRTMIAYAAYRDGKINRETFHRLRRHFFNLWQKEEQIRKKKAKEKKSRPDPNRTKKSENGVALTELVQRTMRAKEITTIKAAKILGTKPTSVHKLFSAT